MSYRGPKRAKSILQAQRHLEAQVGETAVWRRFVSASTGVNVAGFGPTMYYAQIPVSALFYQDRDLAERQEAAGQVIDGTFKVSVGVELGERDELIWRGDAYRVESESTPNRLNETYSYIVKRGQ